MMKLAKRVNGMEQEHRLGECYIFVVQFFGML